MDEHLTSYLKKIKFAYINMLLSTISEFRCGFRKRTFIQFMF